MSGLNLTIADGFRFAIGAWLAGIFLGVCVFVGLVLFGLLGLFTSGAAQ